MRKRKNKDDTTKPTMSVVMRVLLSIILMIFMSVIFTWFLQYRSLLNDAEATWEFVVDRKYVFAYSCILMFLLMAFVVAILWRPFFGIGVVFVIVGIMGYANMQKYLYRAAPLIPEDLKMVGQAGELMSFVDMNDVIRLIIGSILVLVGTGLLEYYARKVIGKPKTGSKWWEKCAILPRTSFSLIALVMFAMASDFIVNHEVKEVDWLETWFTDWSQQQNYDTNGFVIGFIYNLGSSKIPEPDDYGKEQINQIANKYKALKAKDKTREPLDDVVDNIILVMNESFFDPSLYDKYAHSGGDVTPVLHEIFKKYPSGYMYSPEYGGNTANIEFAAFTGLSNYWANTIPYVSLATRIDRLPGMVSFAKNEGFSTTAIHAYDGTMYKRDHIYNRMSFDEFIDKRKMQHAGLENGKGYVSDKGTYTEILDILRDGEKKHFIGAVTMQNHMPYDAAGYPELRFKLRNEIIAGYLLESAFESLAYSDQYLGEFISELDAMEEKTLMIWFGDHAPGVLYEYIDSEDKYEVDLAHLTPYFVYANFELNNDLTSAEVAKINAASGFKFNTKGVDLPTVTPNCLSNIVYNLLGVEKPSLMYLLDEVCEETPILAPIYYRDNTPKASAELKDYELINYDMIGGKHYWLEFNE